MLDRLLTCAIAAALFFLAGCGKSESPKGKAAATDLETRVVRVVTAAEKDSERMLFANGILAAKDQAALSVKVSGRLEEAPIDVGSVVKRGETIAQIQKRDYELQVQQSKAAVAAARARLGLPLEGTEDAIDVKESSLVKEARANLDEQTKNRERITKLRDQGVLSQSELDTAEATYQVAVNKYQEALQETNNRKAMLAQRRAELNIAEQQLADTVVRAPFDGVVQERKASPGEYLMEGAPLATLVRIDPIRLRLEVPERDALAVRKGQRVRFRVDGDTNSYVAQVDRLSPAIAQDNRMLQIEADVANDGRLRPGSFVRSEVVTDTVKAIVLPRNAIVTFAGVEKVFVFGSGKAVERRVTTGPERGKEIEVTRGVKGGEIVILEPGAMRDGQPVTIQKESTGRPAYPNG
ncbi:MAG TPA: efflux RND transporter periplasmic adaptor subunit [Verrucomicrobiae bacterium]|nr:efflux RND transporter periplasmic adaptor subunit [Verrucomicrobiae bacterium]